MSSDEARLRVPKDLMEIIHEEAKRRNQNVPDYLADAIYHYRSCLRKQLEGLPTLRHIITSYPGECSKCGADIPVGSAALWGKDKQERKVLICLDCQIAGTGDKALAKKYIKMREIQSIIQGLNKIAEDLADAVFDPDFLKRQEEFQRRLSEAIEKYENHLRITGTPEEEKKTLNEVLGVLREADRIQKGIDDFLYLHLQKLKKKKAKEKTEQTT